MSLDYKCSSMCPFAQDKDKQTRIIALFVCVNVCLFVCMCLPAGIEPIKPNGKPPQSN